MATTMPELLKLSRFKQFVLRGGIVSDAPGVDSSKGCKSMRLSGGVEYVQHRTICRYCRVRYQGPVTPPRHRLGTHDHGGLEPRQREEIFESLHELPGLHVVCVCPEACIAPLGVVRIAPAAPPATERRQVSVSQTGIHKRSLEARLREVWVAGRRGKGANIDQMCRAFSCKQSEKLLERSGRVPDREQPSGVHAPRSCHPLPWDFQKEE